MMGRAGGNWRRYRDSAATLAVLTLAGCGFQQYTAKPLQPDAYVATFEQRDLDSPQLREFFSECGLPATPWPRTIWDSSALECAALYFHPDLARARAEIEVARAQEITAGQRPNPAVNVQLEHHSDTSGDRTPWSIGPGIDITLERSGQREARIERAVAQTEVARIDLDARIWEVRRTVRDRLLDVADARARKRALEAQSRLLDQGVAMLKRREELGLASSFEVSSMRIELQRTRLAQSAAQARLQTAQAALAAALSVPASATEDIALATDGFSAPPADEPPESPALQRQALTSRADIRRALQQYTVSEATLKEQIARQYPDITLSPGYFFDQADNIWSLGTAIIVPLLNRNEGPIAEAQARREASARAVESVQTNIIGEVNTARAGYRALREQAAEADAVIAGLLEQQQTLQRQFDAGEIDRLALLRAQLEVLNARLLRAELMTEVWRALYRLEDAVQSSLRSNTTESR